LQNLSQYKCAIFDCDGVILQSNDIKTDAFRDALLGEPVDLVDQFISYHKNNGGVSRYKKFEYYYKSIKQVVDYQNESEKAAKRYAITVLSKLKKVDYVPGALDMIIYFNKINVPCYVLSGGDEEELKTVFKFRGIDNKFIDILGSPETKQQHATSMVNNNKITYPGVFFGDASLDMEIANYIKFDFIFISKFSDWSNGVDIATINKMSHYKDFTELL